ncbi:unnamed protein product [Adineta steineri]|uniref:NAD(P)(+)--arginine ADP-ribosyltransferase n=1 Tax=Adineta steineri TaxID=433720 RepID=A0A819WV53_9BILA|nr:unnamed protein product [Adineta steineri]CAF4130929.1 unnamed protein product [Adineta steineri]
MGSAPQSKHRSKAKVLKANANVLQTSEPRSLIAKNDRFTGDSLEWIVSGFEGILKIAQVTCNLPSCSINETVDQIQTANELKGAKGMDEVNKELALARATGDIFHLLRIVDFFHMSAAVMKGKHVKSKVDWPFYVVSTISRYLSTINRSRKPFIGRTYRGMKITKEDLSIYRLHSFIMQKTFSSTSKERSVAKGFVSTCPADMIPTICTYVLDSATSNYSIDLQDISYYPSEAEVLISPFCTFMITKIDRTSESGIVEIELSVITDERAKNLDVGLDNWEPDDETVNGILSALFSVASSK